MLLARATFKDTEIQLLTAIIDASWKVNEYSSQVKCMRRGDCNVCVIHLPLDSKYHIFYFLIIKQSRVCKISVGFDLQTRLYSDLPLPRTLCYRGICISRDFSRAMSLRESLH